MHPVRPSVLTRINYLLPLDQQPMVVYQISCSCGKVYIGKMIRRLETRLKDGHNLRRRLLQGLYREVGSGGAHVEKTAPYQRERDHHTGSRKEEQGAPAEGSYKLQQKAATSIKMRGRSFMRGG